MCVAAGRSLARRASGDLQDFYKASSGRLTQLEFRRHAERIRDNRRVRPLWTDLPVPLRAEIERLVGGKVVAARDCPSGFSPGFASRLTLARGAARAAARDGNRAGSGGLDGRRVFVKAIDAVAYPDQVPTYRAEGRIAAALPAGVPAPRLLGMVEDVRWIVLAFADVDGVPPVQPWDRADLERVLDTLRQMQRVSAPAGLATDHPRLGGWASLVSYEAQLWTHSQWAARNLSRLIDLEAAGVVAAQGGALVHFDLYPINILVAPDRVAFVDWPHARLGVPVIDEIMVLSSVAADGLDPAPYLRGTGREIDAILAAHAGFLMAGALTIPLPALAAAKLHYGLGAVSWLERRLA
jgi:hypothetical protein